MEMGPNQTTEIGGDWNLTLDPEMHFISGSSLSFMRGKLVQCLGTSLGLVKHTLSSLLGYGLFE